MEHKFLEHTQFELVGAFAGVRALMNAQDPPRHEQFQADGAAVCALVRVYT